MESILTVVITSRMNYQMPQRCCVTGCKSNYSSTEYTTVFSFPKSQEMIKDKVKRDDGSWLIVPRLKPKITEDAYPSIFPNCPAYLSRKPPAKRKAGDDRRKELFECDNQQFREWCQKDIIKSLADLKDGISNHVANSWLYLFDTEYVLLYKITMSDIPQVTHAIKLFQNFDICIYFNGTQLDNKNFKWLLGSEKKCDQWTKFEALLSHLQGYNKNER
ncbi:uncharacterized protein LOC111618768 [Centruroides sculpturatus]|uniref:uncharacterized protein LOC111618768 n=1 Tax=Centruroides sculpturatus TaxID=218467 RepID=UPI000C6E1C20|nr:uncharacterized protein LOC111618768 [Centruroides sculpturatus]